MLTEINETGVIAKMLAESDAAKHLKIFKIIFIKMQFLFSYRMLMTFQSKDISRETL